jgi:arylsulfatase A-like enzyme
MQIHVPRAYAAWYRIAEPVESPPEFVNLYPEEDYNASNYARRVYNGMHSGIEYVVKNATEELKAHKMWQNTIFVLTGDNVRRVRTLVCLPACLPATLLTYLPACLVVWASR